MCIWLYGYLVLLGTSMYSMVSDDADLPQFSLNLEHMKEDSLLVTSTYCQTNKYTFYLIH